ncbi:MAG: tetrathionate reductase family octaheme c-type cytochrome [Rhodospirillales bacterium]|jgi:octaheme c-type cytochrome (tetrathionate reductase family)|nr:tetrathionate reductase family octaheme c-type cytochrome [Rhodospirillales bacterium]
MTILIQCFQTATAIAIAVILSAPSPALAGTGGSTADHGKFEALDRKFASGPEVTRACLACHTEAAKQIHATQHWTWDFVSPKTGQRLGKKNVINNFCIAAAPNIAECSSCHVGYGWKDETFDFSSQENVDCLVCHDTTGTYSKKALRTPGGRKPNLKKMAQGVGPTSRRSCGACHFSGGGGKAVKHGDIDPSLDHPDVFVDVHMDADGLNFTCATCHGAENHAVAGSRYAAAGSDSHGIDVPGRDDGNRATCQSCHGARPMKDEKLNQHTDKIACQTCHIPEFSRGDYATKTWWDWSTAGRLTAEGQPFTEEDEAGHEVYNSKKGDFRWRRDAIPEYVWFNGTAHYTLPGQSFDPAKVLSVNAFEGRPDDHESRIWPVKVMRGKQPYDAESKTLAAVQTTGKDGYWKTFDWDTAIARGMAAMGEKFSGRYDFVETEMTWPIAHMVAPADEALGCASCHARDGRLAAVEGVYIPGRDSNRFLDMAGYALIVLTLAGVVLHGALRVVFALRRRSRP